ncbi:MAG: hypothetical protein N2323_02495 [candidate division WOR-3 bacterium]|nr:hypothetical protein [candidate division WOR-3 bacterium]
MDRLTKNLVITNDLEYEELRFYYSLEKKGRKNNWSYAKPLEVASVNITESITQKSYNRVTDILMVDNIKISAHLLISFEPPRGELHFYVNGIEEAYIIEEISTERVKLEAHYTKPGFNFYDLTIECIYEPSIPFSPSSPIKVKFNTQGKEIEGEITLKEPYPSLIEEMINTIDFPKEPLTIAFNPSVIGAIVEYGRSVPLRFYLQELPLEYVREALSALAAALYDAGHCNWACTADTAIMNVLMLAE